MFKVLELAAWMFTKLGRPDNFVIYMPFSYIYAIAEYVCCLRH